MRLGRLLVAATIAALPLACGARGSGDGPFASSSSAIIDGVTSTAAQNYVVLVAHPSGDGVFVCSGSLVAPNLVLTARHCISETPDVGFFCDESGDGTDGGSIGADYDPSSVYVYAGLDAPTQFSGPSAVATRYFHDDATNVCNHDLALFEITPPLTGMPLATLDLDSKVTTGELITAIGWGVVADGGSPAQRQQLGGVAVLNVGPASDSAGFDVAPNEFDVGQSICEGDSGGPALAPSGAVVGVVSRGGNGVDDAALTNPAATCLGSSTVNIYTETAPFRDVILDAFEAVDATPMLVSVPMGEACTSSSECTSGLCAAVEADAGTTCTQDCATEACPSGYRCDVTGGHSLCAPAPSSGCALAPDGDVPSLGAGFAAFAVLAARRSRRSRRAPGRA
jgi:hypothetical protein